MASNWAQKARSGWLCSLYGTSNASGGTRSLAPESVQSQLIDILEALLSATWSARDSAAKTASLVMAHEDVDTPWSNLLGLYLAAAETFGGEKESHTLAEYIIALAKLPDAVNDGPGTKTLGAAGRIEQGQPVVFEDGHKLFRDLPGFSQNLTESFQGPERYLANLRTPASPDAAKTSWRNLNTCIALISRSPEAQSIPVLASLGKLGLRTLAMALEHPPDTRIGQNIELHVPAAAQWLRIAGDEIERLSNAETERMDAGSLWSGGDLCDNTRLRFWRARIEELGY